MPQDPAQQAAFLEDIRSLIAHDDLPQALQQLKRFLDHTPLLDEALHQGARFEAIRKQIRLGTVSQEEANLARNQISIGLLDLLQAVEDRTESGSGKTSINAEEDALRAEIGLALTIMDSKKPVLNSNITAVGDVHIGDKHLTQQADKIYNIDRIDKADFS